MWSRDMLGELLSDGLRFAVRSTRPLKPRLFMLRLKPSFEPASIDRLLDPPRMLKPPLTASVRLSE